MGLVPALLQILSLRTLEGLVKVESVLVDFVFLGPAPAELSGGIPPNPLHPLCLRSFYLSLISSYRRNLVLVHQRLLPVQPFLLKLRSQVEPTIFSGRRQIVNLAKVLVFFF